MQPQISFHRIKSLSITEVKEFSQSENTGPFAFRELIIEADDGQYRVYLYGSAIRDLTLPVEAPPAVCPAFADDHEADYDATADLASSTI